jgi:hypothetical protein
MRALIALVIVAGSAAPVLRAAQHSAAQLAARLNSSDLATRSIALSELTERSTEPGLLTEKPVQAAILSQVRSANTMARTLYRNSTAGDEARNEAFGDYYSELLELAMKALPEETGAKRAWLAALVQASFNGDSPFAQWLATFGDNSVDAVLHQAASAQTPPDKWGAYAVVAQMVVVTAPDARTNVRSAALSQTNRRRALRAVEQALDVADPVTAKEVVRALGDSPSPEAVAILRAFLKRGRSQPGFNSSDNHQRWLLEEVERTIAHSEAALRGRG